MTRFKNSRFVVAVAAFASACMAIVARAEEAAAPVVVEDVSLIDVIFQGGAIGAVIIGLSVVGGALIIEFFISLKREKLVPPDVLGELEQLLDEQDYEQAMTLCDDEVSPLTRVVGAGLAKVSHGFDVMMPSAMKAAENEAVRMHQRISWLALLGNIGPMLGLLGTVWGMIIAFNKIAKIGTPEPGELAEGISIALVTTVLGLCIAIPTMAFFFYFRNRVVRAITDVEAITIDLLERFRPHPA